MISVIIFGLASVGLSVASVILGFRDVGFNRLFSADGFSSFTSCFGFGHFDQWIVTIGLIAVGGLFVIGLLTNLPRKAKGPRLALHFIFTITAALAIYIYGAAPTPYPAVPGILSLASIALAGITLLKSVF